MFLLFVDTETSGVNFNTDQIIEIGATLMDLNTKTLQMQEIDRFANLVALRQNMDEKITRITGIESLELQTAPKLHHVQEKWASWLENLVQKEPEKSLIVIGHSVDFDLNFLRKENWFLPENHLVLDTLPLAKIFLPYLSAVNLEFLSQKLDLAPQAGSNLRAHRALYDAICCQNLLGFILQQILSLPLEKEFLEFLREHFLPLKIEIYTSKNNFLAPESQLEASNVINLDITGEVIEANLSQKLNRLEQVPVSKITALFKEQIPDSLALTVAQLYLIFVWRHKEPNWQLKLHGQGREYIWAEVLVDFLEEK